MQKKNFETPLIKQSDDLKSEILLLETQAKRCKEILLNLSKDPQNVKDTFLYYVLLVLF